MARVVGDLPRGGHSPAVDNRTSMGPTLLAEAHTGETERAAIGIRDQLSRRTARLQQYSRPAILAEKKHMELLEKQGQRPLSSMELLTRMC